MFSFVESVVRSRVVNVKSSLFSRTVSKELSLSFGAVLAKCRS
jgi:hypothetical protein